MYNNLVKLFHSDREQYEKEYDIRYNNPYTTIHFDFLVNAQATFLVQLPILYESIDRIWRLNQSVVQLIGNLPDHAITQFIDKCLVDEVLMSNKIENVNSTRQELNDILVNLDERKIRKFHGMVARYKMLTEDEKQSVTSPQDVRNIFDDLVFYLISKENPKKIPDGKLFRKEGVNVYSATQKIIHQGVVPEEKIIEELKKALAILNDTKINSFFRIALFHYFFGYIHPFYDGNGRVGRFISSLLLKQELNELIGYRISYTINENLKEYYDAFKICNMEINKGDLTPFVLMFIGIIEKSMEQLESALRKRANSLNRCRGLICKLPYSSKKGYEVVYDLLIQAALFADIEGGISIEDLVEVTETTRATIGKKLKDIRENDLLIEKKIGRRSFYLLSLSQLEKR